MFETRINFEGPIESGYYQAGMSAEEKNRTVKKIEKQGGRVTSIEKIKVKKYKLA